MFTIGFEKTAIDLGRAAKSGVKMLKNPAVIRNAAVGAGAGAVAGAANNSEDRLGGALRGAVLGAGAGGIGTMAHKAYKTTNRFNSGLGKKVAPGYQPPLTPQS